MRTQRRLRIVLFLAACSLASGIMRADDAPNILVISIDDLNDWVGCLGGHPQAATPNIDRLAKSGTLFTNAHCQAPICTPSRASLVTGLLPTTTGLYFLQPGLRSSEIAARQPTIMAALAAAGYRTMSAGKFVHGRREGGYFDDYGGDLGGFGPNPTEKLNCPHGGINWDWGAYPKHESELPDTKIADWVIDRLSRDDDEPFFLVAGFWRPHVPLYVPEDWMKRFPLDQVKLPEVKRDDRNDLSEYAKDLTIGHPAPRHEWFVEEDHWRSAVRAYLACIAFADHCVGRVLDALESSPHRDDTIVVLFSDHGWHLGEKQRWAKRSLWADGTRVPLIIAAPGFDEAQVTNQPVGLVDLYPTLLELTGTKQSMPLDGESLVPLLRNPRQPRIRPVITTFGPNNHAVRTERWSFIQYADGSRELYDLKNDQNEWRNLSSEVQHQALIQKLAAQLPTKNLDPVRSNWTRWEVEAWETAERNAKKRQESAGQ